MNPKLLRSARAIACTAFLGSCASWTAAPVTPGMPEAEVIQRLGRPTHVYQDGGNRLLEYMHGPMGQTTEMAKIGPDGRLASFEQVLTMQKFAQIKLDQTRRDDVLRLVGAPSETGVYRRTGLEFWNYPYKESDTWDSMMTVYFDRNGIVRRLENGPDPRRMPSDRGHGH
jgi:outer membrane protein assembly factor BamE (lipoprotein component of BamABCDE complex)